MNTPYIPLGILRIKNNGCCKNDFIVITKSRNRDIYSCECGCQCGWCTNGHENVSDAINEYLQMCKKEELK